MTNFYPPLSPDAMPILSLTLEGMRLNLQQALLSQQEEISNMVQGELDRVCTPEALRELVRRKVDAMVRERIAKEIESYFSYGEGAEAIKAAVNAQLAVNLTGVFDNIAKRARRHSK